jgi:hypothetical protein
MQQAQMSYLNCGTQNVLAANVSPCCHPDTAQSRNYTGLATATGPLGAFAGFDVGRLDGAGTSFRHIPRFIEALMGGFIGTVVRVVWACRQFGPIITPSSNLNVVSMPPPQP